MDMQPVNSHIVRSTYSYAGFFRRFAAFAIDIFIGFILLQLFSAMRSLSFSNYDNHQSTYNGIIWIVTFMSIFYGAIMESSKLQGTLGKIILGIKVTNTEGGQISFINSLGRSALKAFLSILLTSGIGCLIAAFTKRKQALHDMPSHCMVVLRKPEQRASVKPEEKISLYPGPEQTQQYVQQIQAAAEEQHGSKEQDVIEQWGIDGAEIKNITGDRLPQITAEFQNALSSKLVSEGLPVNNDYSVNHIKIMGHFVRIDGGGRAKRYFSNGLAGKSCIEVNGEIIINGVLITSLHAQKDLGFAFQVFGGDNDKMLEICAKDCGHLVAEQAIKALLALKKKPADAENTIDLSAASKSENTLPNTAEQDTNSISDDKNYEHEEKSFIDKYFTSGTPEDQIQLAIAKLVEECKWHFNNVDRYYDVESEFIRREKDIIRPIGEMLNDRGGLPLMRKVYAVVEKQCGRSCRSALEMKWNRIGEWRS